MAKRSWISAIFQPQPVSLEYRQWRDRLIHQRFWLILGLALAWLCVQGIADAYEVFINPEQLLNNLAKRQLEHLFEPIRARFIWHKVVAISLITILALAWKNRWLRKNSRLMLLFVPWSIAFIPEMVVSIYFKLPAYPSDIMFMAQAVLMPIHWRLHLISQLVPIAFFFGVYPLIGMGEFAGQSIYSFSNTVGLLLVCTICEVGVFLYESSKQSELAAIQRLQLCINSITHDLRTPVMGSLMLLKSIRDSVPQNQTIQLSQTEMRQLIQGSDRLLNLMNTLLDHQILVQGELVLNCQLVQLSSIVESVLEDFKTELVQQNVVVKNDVQADLPMIYVDPSQIRRVLYNLISNAIYHNSPGITLTIDAIAVRNTLKVMVQDNGIGISPNQRESIFEPYSRGQQAQYQPGLGLGLYICRQIVLAHQGEIYLEAANPGAMFWFTLTTHQSLNGLD
jgi:signal transduction histidine kinase